MPSEPKPEADLYSYTVRYDDGAAPNPFNGMCTLAICKPAIRRTAAPGDATVCRVCTGTDPFVDFPARG